MTQLPTGRIERASFRARHRGLGGPRVGFFSEETITIGRIAMTAIAIYVVGGLWAVYHTSDSPVLFTQ
jgi:hypothetical protein